MPPTYEMKKVHIGNNTIEVIAFDTFFELTLGGHSWGQPAVKVMMSRDDADSLAEAIKTVLEKRRDWAAPYNSARPA